MSRTRLNSPKRLAFTWSTKPAANAFPLGVPVYISDVAGGSLWYSSGAGWVPVGGSVLLAAGEPALNHTGDTTDQTQSGATDRVIVTLPADIMGPHGVVRVETLWSYTNSGNTKTLRVRFGGFTGTSFQLPQPTTTATAQLLCVIRNTASKSAQAGFAPSSSNTYVSSTSAITTATIDTSQAQDILIGGQLSLGTESVKLEAYRVWVEPAW